MNIKRWYNNLDRTEFLFYSLCAIIVLGGLFTAIGVLVTAEPEIPEPIIEPVQEKLFLSIEFYTIPYAVPYGEMPDGRNMYIIRWVTRDGIKVTMEFENEYKYRALHLYEAFKPLAEVILIAGRLNTGIPY